MARTPITPQKINPAGTNLAAEPANVDGNSFALNPAHLLMVTNGSAAALTVTIPTPAKVAGLDVAERTVAVPAGETRYVGLRGASVYRQLDGMAHVDYSPDPDATVTVAVLSA